MTNYKERGKNYPINDHIKIASKYIKEGGFKLEFIIWIPFWAFTDGSKEKYWRLLYLFKIIRMKEAIFLMSISRLMAPIKNFFHWRLQRFIDNNPDEADGIIRDKTNINLIAKIQESLKVFRLAIIIINGSYFTGILWFILCDLTRYFYEMFNILNKEYFIEYKFSKK